MGDVTETATRQTSVNGGYRWVILGTVSLVQSIVAIAAYSFGPLAPFLRDTFNIGRVQLGLFNSMISLAMLLLSLPAGWLIDRFGIRRLLLLGPGMFGLVFALLSLAPSIGIAYVVVFLAGIGYAFVTPTTTMALVQWFPVKSRATAVSIKQSALTLGSSAGAVIVPALSIWLGWRYAVVILGAAAVLVVAFSHSIYRESPAPPAEGRAPALTALRRVVADKRFIHLGICGIIYYSLQMGINTYLVLQLVEVRQMSAVAAGTFLMAANLGGAAGRVLWGAISDRAFGGQRRPVLVIIGIISGITAIALAMGGASLPGWLLYLNVAVLGIAALGWNGVLLTFVTEISHREVAATGLGWTMTIINLGAVVGPPLFGYIVDRTSSYSPAWLAFGTLTIVAAVSMALIREDKARG